MVAKRVATESEIRIEILICDSVEVLNNNRNNDTRIEDKSLKLF